MAEIELQGIQELMDRMTELGKRGSKIGNKALKAAAQPILDDMVLNAPVRTGKGVAALKTSRVKTKGDTKTVLIGIEKGDISEVFYMKFHEFGTSKMPEKPFMQPAYESKKGEAIRILKEEFRRGLGL